jgi:hypothetical protein
MTLPLVPLLGLVTFALAGMALLTRRLFARAMALSAMGAALFSLLFVAGFPGMAVSALAAVWGVAAGGLVVGWTLSRVEAPLEDPGRRGPWLLALASSTLLSGALAIGILAVDWPGTRPDARSVAPAPDAALAGWALAALTLAAALALAAFSPRGDERP